MFLALQFTDTYIHNIACSYAHSCVICLMLYMCIHVSLVASCQLNHGDINHYYSECMNYIFSKYYRLIIAVDDFLVFENV